MQFSVTADHPGPIAALGDALAAAGKTVEVLLDVDPGMHRTGIAPGPAAVKLYSQIATTKGLEPGGLALVRRP